jgi:hypothetical protein
MNLPLRIWHYARSICPRIPPRAVCALMTLAVWADAAAALAQRKKAGEEPAAAGGKSYVLSYMLIVLCIALGLLVVCRSGGRANEPKQDLQIGE